MHFVSLRLISSSTGADPSNAAKQVASFTVWCHGSSDVFATGGQRGSDVGGMNNKLAKGERRRVLGLPDETIIITAAPRAHPSKRMRDLFFFFFTVCLTTKRDCARAPETRLVFFIIHVVYRAGSFHVLFCFFLFFQWISFDGGVGNGPPREQPFN